MKAISIRQPWAELIVQGRKTLELRRWTTDYRGPLAIHAAQTIERPACRAFGLDADRLVTGAIIGVVELAEIVPLDAATFEARRAEHLHPGAFAAPLFGWQLTNPRRLDTPRPLRGRMSLFHVADLPGGPPARQPPAGTNGAPESHSPAERPFELRVTRSPDNPAAYRLALYQRRPAPNGNGDRPAQRVAELGGPTLRAVADHVLDALRSSGYRATDLSAARREPFRLNEEAGVRLGLLFLALRPVSKPRRVEAIAHGLRRMTSEETYYWYSKCAAPALEHAPERAQRALRVLLADE